ncbi:hypothetical protein [Streptomyces sp. NRRL B-24085]|uniref:hypothetical protein n=1 Tax=Streptomyces sp. NRRL B-24085 TaxID=1709476 RepID=UPI0006B3089B|nr:hypothetical protein [Streptomyces sp. NRRL B-24085]
MIKKMMQATAVLVLAMGTVTGVAATAQAGEQGVRPTGDRGSVSVQSVKWQGPFGTYSSCLTVQNEFRRYYDITITCTYYASSGYYFAYEDGR